MVLPASYGLNNACFAAIAALVAVGSSSSSMFASAALEFTVADCSDFAALPSGLMSDDVNLFLDDAMDFTCDEVTTVTVDGPFEYHVTSDNANVTFTNVRFDILGGANFTFDLGVDEFLGEATFTGVTDLAANGGVFNVESGSFAAFEVPMVFENNSVSAGYAGGAVYASGQMDFKYAVQFNGNKVLSDGDVDAGDGGGLCVASRGEVSFQDFTWFRGNRAESGGQGGAVANFGYLLFERASYLSTNTAAENGDEIGGSGGAVFTGVGSSTAFERRTIMQFNTAASGGALYNLGTTILGSNGFIRGNQATGVDRADGGHIYTSGLVSFAGDVNLREGSALIGGAVYIDVGGSLVTESDVVYTDNSASERCPDVFASELRPRCQP